MEKVKGDFRNAKLLITLRPSAKLKVGELRKAVQSTGYTATWIRFKARGRVVKGRRGYCFEVEKSGQQIRLASGGRMKDLLRALVKAGRRWPLVEITGLFRSGSDKAVVEAFRLLP